jgi:hypothetical protein
MADLDKALATQLTNIEHRTGTSLDELAASVRGSGLAQHGELVTMLKTTLGMGHGDANTLVHVVEKMGESGATGAATPATASAAASPAPADAGAVLDGLYTGARSALRPIHDAVLAAMRAFGPFEEAPKKTDVSYRRAKQFRMVGPATNSRVEVGLNMKGLPATDRLEALPAGQMCQYKVRLTDASQVDAELIGWIRQAYDAAG